MAIRDNKALVRHSGLAGTEGKTSKTMIICDDYTNFISTVMIIVMHSLMFSHHLAKEYLKTNTHIYIYV